jgi:hypothetical protein
MPLEDTNGHNANPWPQCEYGKTLFGRGECPRVGEVQLDGSLLCLAHTKLLRLEVRESALLGEVFEMDQWLENPSNRADELRWRRLLHERDEVVEQLRFNRTLIEAHKGPERQQ